MLNKIKPSKGLPGKTNLYKKVAFLAGCCALLSMSGCNVIGWIAYGFGSDTVKVLAQYPNLDNHSIAVMVSIPDKTMYTYPKAQLAISKAISKRLGNNLKNVHVADPKTIISFQRTNPYWMAMRYSELVKDIGVERLIIVDVSTYRTHEQGNVHLWKGVIDANIGVISAESNDSDNFVFNQHIRADYPTDTKVGVIDTDNESMRQGLVSLFSLKAAGLFYDHKEPKENY